MNTLFLNTNIGIWYKIKMSVISTLRDISIPFDTYPSLPSDIIFHKDLFEKLEDNINRPLTLNTGHGLFCRTEIGESGKKYSVTDQHANS
jgi:hypothetical protein